MIKYNIRFIVFFILTFVFKMNNCWGAEFIYVKQTYFTNQPSPSISATSTDKTTKWFDDYPKAESNSELEIGFLLPKNYGLSFRKSQLSGVHKGDATKYVCIIYCSYISSGIVSGNSSTDKISYDIDSWQIMLDRSYKLNIKNGIIIKPRIGINILDTSLKFSGAGQNVSEKQILPLPFLGVHSEFKINSTYSFFIDTNYFKYKETKIGVHYYDTSIGINSQINKYLTFIVGYKKYDLGISNEGGSSNISFNIEQKTPFVGFSLSY